MKKLGAFKVQPPKWRHPMDTSDGRVERATWALREAQAHGKAVADTLAYLETKGCTGAEIMDAMNQAIAEGAY